MKSVVSDDQQELNTQRPARDGNDEQREVFLVTGAAGLLGSYLVPLLREQCPRSEIVAVARRDDQLTHLAGLAGVKAVLGDLREVETWQRLPTTITHVFHLAAAIPRRGDDADKVDVVSDNLAPISHLITQCWRWPAVRQIVYSSSVSVYGRTTALLDEQCETAPCSPYGAAKVAGEYLLGSLRAQGIRVACLRYTSLYGEGMHPGTVLSIMVRCAREDEEIVVHGHGYRVQDFCHCYDAACANLLAYKVCTDGVFNIGSGVSTAMRDLADIVSDVFTGGRAAVTFAASASEGQPGYNVDIGKARRKLGYAPKYTLEQGLREMNHRILDRGKCAQFLYS